MIVTHNGSFNITDGTLAVDGPSTFLGLRIGTDVGAPIITKIDTDATLVADSDARVATQHAAKTYIDGHDSTSLAAALAYTDAHTSHTLTAPANIYEVGPVGKEIILEGTDVDTETYVSWHTAFDGRSLTIASPESPIQNPIVYGGGMLGCMTTPVRFRNGFVTRQIMVDPANTNPPCNSHELRTLTVASAVNPPAIVQAAGTSFATHCFPAGSTTQLYASALQPYGAFIDYYSEFMPSSLNICFSTSGTSVEPISLFIRTQSVAGTTVINNTGTSTEYPLTPSGSTNQAIFYTIPDLPIPTLNTAGHTMLFYFERTNGDANPDDLYIWGLWTKYVVYSTTVSYGNLN